eukprot:1201878-Amphidinium_carterae.1
MASKGVDGPLSEADLKEVERVVEDVESMLLKMGSTSNEEDAWALAQSTSVQEGIEGRSEEGQTPPSLIAVGSQEMCGGSAAPEETEQLR